LVCDPRMAPNIWGPVERSFWFVRQDWLIFSAHRQDADQTREVAVRLSCALLIRDGAASP